MTTPADLAQARAAQATADREAAEVELIAAMKTIEPSFTGTVDAMLDRHWESKLEGIRPFWELARAHSTWRRAKNTERKARSAAHLAKFAAVPAAPAPPRRKKAPRRMTIAAYLAEARAA